MSTQHAQSVCLNGHQVGSSLTWGTDANGFCEKCGAKVISKCPNCDYPIAGYYDASGNGIIFLSTGPVPIPKYCKNCGKPYPWTESAIKSAQDLISYSELSSDEVKDFQESIPDLLSDTPKTKLASTKFKIYAAKAGTVVAQGLRDILVDIASEAVKKSIWEVVPHCSQ